MCRYRRTDTRSSKFSLVQRIKKKTNFFAGFNEIRLVFFISHQTILNKILHIGAHLPPLAQIPLVW
ncbi:hypothetical protein THIOM_001146 [Candidatus Thiomargarita nelsonii]|uniref:Uncharacterized protein n=1 Tax=Candidatus Thiomargarita nelsonii TaxID=1003181 RepID=A0A176S526_9GAMM|nr:hypothetical protein THIOM_001146 [Candidatus Thiomargarita nelsonii]